MNGSGGAVKRAVAYGAAAVMVFVGTLMALPEPEAPGGAAATGGQGDAIPEGTFAVTGATVFDGERFLADHDVRVEDGLIRAVGTALDIPEGVARVDGRGRTLVPGLIDAHVHTFGTTLNDAVRFGVTSVLDQFTDPALAASKRAARETVARGDEADLFTAGMLATAAGGHGTQFGIAVEPVSGPADAVAWVAARKAEGSDWIKIVYEDGSPYMDIPSLEPETIGALIAAAHAEGLLAVVHVSKLAHALEAVDLGADGLVHVWGDAVADEAQAARIAEAGVFVVPTLSVVTAMSGDGIDIELPEGAAGAAVSRMQRETLANRFPDIPGEARPASRGDTAVANVRRLHAAGVRLLAGTDAPNPGTGSGVSQHGELQLLVRAGLTGAEALAAATSTPAAIFGLEDRGRIEAGRIADLVLVDGDLESDVAASTRLVAVWKDGYRVALSLDQETSAAPAAPATTLISDFEEGVSASFGAGWLVTTDQVQGGTSTAELSASQGALRVEGEVVAGDSAFTFPWAGAIYFPGPAPMQPVDFSGREVLRFRTRGDGRGYLVMLFSGGASATVPPSVPFTAPADWTDVEIPLARFPTATPGLIGGLAFVATAPPGVPSTAGAFAFELDDVEIR